MISAVPGRFLRLDGTSRIGAERPYETNQRRSRFAAGKPPLILGEEMGAIR